MPDPNLRGFQEQNGPKMNRDTGKRTLISKVSSTRTVSVRSNTEQRAREREREQNMGTNRQPIPGQKPTVVNNNKV